MKFMEPSFSRFTIPDASDKMAVLKHLELIGRVCYKSEERITDESCISFLSNIKKRKHWAMLEHYVFVMRVPDDVFNSLMECMFVYNDIPEFNHRIKYINMTSYQDKQGEYVNLVSGSATAFNYLWEVFPVGDISNGITTICRFLESEYPELMMNPCTDSGATSVDINDDISFLSRQEIESLPINERTIHDTMSVRFITNRGVTHEIVRHRPVSYAQESTRYCNYGNNGCMFIIPHWVIEHDYQLLLNHVTDDNINIIMGSNNPLGLNPNTLKWLAGVKQDEETYLDLLAAGLTPQDARGNLNNDLKTEIVMTANLFEWRHFFNMRADKPAHPAMKQIAYPLLHAVYKDIPDIFDELEKRAVKEGM